MMYHNLFGFNLGSKEMDIIFQFVVRAFFLCVFFFVSLREIAVAS